MINRLSVRGLKSLFAQEVHFAPITVLLGPNAVGKSNLLESIALLSRIVTSKTLVEAFDAPLRGNAVEMFSLPEGGLPGLLNQNKAELSIEADISPGVVRSDRAKPGDPLRYRVNVDIDPNTGTLSVADEYLVRLKKDGIPKHSPRIEKERQHLVVRRLGERGQPRREAVGLHYALVSDRQFAGLKKYPDFDALRKEMGTWRMYFLDPRVSMRKPQAPRETQDIGPQGEWLAPFLYRVKEQKEHQRYFSAIRRALHNAIPAIENLDVDLDKKRGFLDIQIVQDGVPYSSRVISEGTLRVLALCALAGNPWPANLVAFEEPENGVHPRRIQVIANLLVTMARSRNTQVIVTSHSPTFISTMIEHCRSSPELISLLRCRQVGRETEVVKFDVTGPLFSDQEVQDALRDSGDEDLVHAALVRGWLDG